MALSATHLKQVNLGTDIYDISAKYLHDANGNEKTLEEILALHNLEIRFVDALPTASAATMNAIYLVPNGKEGDNNKDEYITVKEGSNYKWQVIGTTQTELSGYAKKGEYTGSALSDGAHTHTVSGTVAVPTVTKSDKKLGISRTTNVAVGANGTANAITGFGAHPTENVLGSDTTFTVTGGVASTTNIKATASGTAVGADGTAKAITGFGAHSTDSFVTAGAAINVSGGTANKTYMKATASDVALNTNSKATFVKSYPGETSKMVVDSVVPAVDNGTVVPAVAIAAGSRPTKTVLGTPDTASKVSVTNGSAASWTGAEAASFTQGSKASWSASVNESGVLSFNWAANGDDTFVANKLGTFVPNTPTAVSASDVSVPVISSNAEVEVAKAASQAVAVAKVGTAKNFATGALASTGTGGSVMTGLGEAVSGDALTNVTVSSQPTITLATDTASGTGKVQFVTGVSAVTAALDAGAKADAITALGTATTADALTGVKVTTQPTVSLATGATAGTGVISVATGVSAVGVTANADDTVAVLTGLGEATTAAALTGVQVTTQPNFTLNNTGTDGIAFVESVTVGSENKSLVGGAAASDGAHTHTTKVTL